MEHIYKNAFSVEDRRSERKRLSMLTSVRELGGANQPICLEDISAVGFAGSCHVPFRVPTLVSVALAPLGEVKARVIWVYEGRVGGEFIQKLDDGQLESVLAAAG